MRTGFEGARYRVVISKLKLSTIRLTQSRHSNETLSDSFQDMVNAGLELRERQTQAVKYLLCVERGKLDEPPIKAETVARILDGNNAPGIDARLAAADMIEARERR